MKSVQIRSFSGLYFPVFGLNTEIYSVFSPKTGKYVPEKTLYLDNLHAVGVQDNKWITYVPWILVLCSLATYYVKSGRIWDLHWSIYSYTWTLILKYLSFRSVTLSVQCSHVIPQENTRKHLIFCCFLGVENEDIEQKLVDSYIQSI